MRLLDLKTSALLLSILFMGLFISYFYESLISRPIEGDSIAYHIPISKSVLNGEILRPVFYLGYYPANAELILSLFVLLSLPLNLFNILGWLMLLLSLVKLARTYGFSIDYALVYGISICSMHGIIRWLNSQVIDIWLAVFFTLNLIIFRIFKGTELHFLLLGLSSGLLMGAKYSGPLYVLVLFAVYFKVWRQYLNLKKLIILMIPVLIFGISWYARNLILTGNPVYPQQLFWMEGLSGWKIFQIQVWKATIANPLLAMNAYIAEFMIWHIIIVIFISSWVVSLFQKNGRENKMLKLLIIGLFNLTIYLLLPTNNEYNIIVSSIRYIYPALIPLMLLVFRYCQEIKKREWLALIAVSVFGFLPQLNYRPKLLLLSIPIYFAFYYYNYILKKYFIKLKR